MQMQNVDLVTFWGFPMDFLQRKQVSVKKMDNFYIHSHTAVEKNASFYIHWHKQALFTV